MTVCPARPDELTAAFRLLYGPAADPHITHAFGLVARGELNPADLLVARADDTLTGAVFCQQLPGSVAVIWPPRAVGDDPAVQDALTAAALAHVAGVKVVQAFLPPEEAGRAGPLLRAGFRRVTRVWQMDRLAATRQRSASPRAPGELAAVTDGEPGCVSAGSPPNGAEPLPGRALPALAQPGSPVTGVEAAASGEASRSAIASRLTFTAYPDVDPAEFARNLVRAHDLSLDCPELNGVRSPDDVLAGYRDCAPDLSQWWLARLGDEPVGVLILGSNELSFVGVVPDRRGQGIGRALVEAAVSWHPGLSLIVDERNAPAIALYRSLGFETVGARDVFLRLR